jgi:hypothetical protein
MAYDNGGVNAHGPKPASAREYDIGRREAVLVTFAKAAGVPVGYSNSPLAISAPILRAREFT